MQINAWFLLIAFALVILWKVDFFATLLNLKSLGAEIPEAFRGLIDQEAYERSQEYNRDKAVLGIGESVFSLLLLFTWQSSLCKLFLEISAMVPYNLARSEA